jgi:tetratricopeptide (TPR) repeat protein
LQALRSAGLLAETPLGGLSVDGLGALCRARWPQQDWPLERVQELWRRCGGNPFFAGELVAVSLAGTDGRALPRRSSELVLRRLRALAPMAQALVEAAAVLARPASFHVLAATCGRDPDAAVADDVAGCERALAVGLLVESGGGLECRHDLVRSAVHDSLSIPRRQWLHRRAALALGSNAEPLALALHWEAAGEPQTALAWRRRGAVQLKEYGRLDEARALWRQIAAEATDPALALRARLDLAECNLFDDLDAGQAALEAVLEQTTALADPAARVRLEAQALAGLVDNRVFAGDQPRARALAARLRPLLPQLDVPERVHALEVLIELAMREPDIEGALALLAEARRLLPQRPALLSFEAQIHWFGGRVHDARTAFEQMLERHPEYCRGLTIENDLAVMCHAQGDLPVAEALARRSLESWQGVAHTEALSLLVLGSVLTSAGRYAEAADAFDRAEALARQQASQLFLSEVHIRRARLLAWCGRYDDALAQIAQAAPLVRDDDNPLRSSQLLTVQVAALAAQGAPLPEAARAQLQAACRRSAHPLVHARRVRVECEFALAGGAPLQAQESAARMVAIARTAGLLEVLAEALLLQVRSGERAGTVPAALLPLAHEAATQAEARGYPDLAWRACAWLARVTGDPAFDERADAALALLRAAATGCGFDAERAALRDPMFGSTRPSQPGAGSAA